MYRTNRGLINEYLWSRWCWIKAAYYSMFTWQDIIEEWDGDRLVSISVGDKLFYEYGRE